MMSIISYVQNMMFAHMFPLSTMKKYVITLSLCKMVMQIIYCYILHIIIMHRLCSPLWAGHPQFSEAESFYRFA